MLETLLIGGLRASPCILIATIRLSIITESPREVLNASPYLSGRRSCWRNSSEIRFCLRLPGLFCRVFLCDRF